eukprot:3739947-Pyramimonas_sp.AAC.1
MKRSMVGHVDSPQKKPLGRSAAPLHYLFAYSARTITSPQGAQLFGVESRVPSGQSGWSSRPGSA